MSNKIMVQLNFFANFSSKIQVKVKQREIGPFPSPNANEKKINTKFPSSEPKLWTQALTE